MNYQEALAFIHSLKTTNVKPTLDRISAISSALGNPQDGLRFIHVAGTNGKGSTCTMLAEMLKKAGYRVGLFTSPYIIAFTERIRVNGEFISEADVARLCERVRAENIELNEFEFITAMAFLYFLEQGCDIVVLETGLGGRFDATNVIKPPLCSVITKIDLDHTALLGNTVEEIAGEKCGIIKQGSPTVSYPLQDEGALSVITASAEKLTLPDIDNLQIISSTIFGNTFIYMGEEYRTSLVGLHQVYNALTAIEAVKASGIDVSLSDIKEGLKNATVPARLELVCESPTVLLDGAHNPNGAEALARFIGDKRPIAIIGMMADKSCDEFLSLTLPLCSAVITVSVEGNPRAMSADALADIAKKYSPDTTSAVSYSEAVELARLKSAGKIPVFAFGSLYLASEVRDLLYSAFNS